MQEGGRRYRGDQIYVKDWCTFLQAQKNYDFIKSLGDFTPQQCRSQIKTKFLQLAQDQKFQCYVFPNSLKPEYLALMTKLLEEEDLRPLLDYDYQSLFLGNPKQMVVFKKRASVATYLSKYRPTKKYQEVFAQVLELAKQYLRMIAARNMKISEQAEQEEIQAKTTEMTEFKEQKLDPKLQTWRKLVRQMLQDFIRQPKKQQFLFMGINNQILHQLKTLSKHYELYLSNRFQKVSINDQFRDVSITKYDRNEEYSGGSKSFTQDDEEKLEQISAVEAETEAEEKEIVLRVPKNIQVVNFREFGPTGVNCLVQILTFGRSNPVDYFQITLIPPKDTEIQYKYEQKVQVTFGQYLYEVNLPCLYTGCSTFEIKTVNSVGSCKNPYIFKIWMQGIPNSANSQGFLQIATQNNFLYMLGSNSQGLIPNWQPQNMDILTTTDQKWLPLKFACSDFSVSSHGTICNRAGDVASWGKMYYFDEDGLNQDQNVSEEDEEEEDELELGKLQTANYRIEKPSFIQDGAFIRKISCGEGYCLMADAQGRAWSFGLNTFGQLGLGHINQSTDTSDPAVITHFTSSQIFITDIIASYYGASFAIDSAGQAYRWGTNQIDRTDRPIKDNFNGVINYEYPDIVATQSTPLLVGKKFITEKVREIQAGFGFVVALTENNRLYGWGKCRYLGLGEVADAHFKTIQNLCNPIPVQQGVRKVTVGWNHCVALKTNNDLVGWGEAKYYRDEAKQDEFITKPEIIKQNYKGLFECGPDFTVYGQEQNKIRIVGNRKIFTEKQYELPCQPIKLQAGEGIIMVMGKKNPQTEKQKKEKQEKEPFESKKEQEIQKNQEQ